MSVDANDVLFGGGTPAARFVSPGDTFAGPITKLEAQQARKFDKGKPTDELDFWPNGDPKMVAVATIKTDHRDASDPSDDGQRKVYIASRDMQAKVREAVKGAGQRKLDIGGVLSVTFVGEEKSESGLMAKVYEVGYTPAMAAAANTALGQAVVPPLGQMLGANPGQQAAATAPVAPQGMNLENLPPEARAKVEAMLAAQQS